MKRIIRIGMDVHSTNYTLCAMEPIIGEDDRIFATVDVTPDYKNILMFIENLKMKLGVDNQYDIQLCLRIVLIHGISAKMFLSLSIFLPLRSSLLGTIL